MKDSYGRIIDYMRISITDRCNLRCRYCMPEGISQVPMEEILTYEEIEELCRAASELGISRLKITGGEPLVRSGCPRLIGMLKKIPGIEQVTMTTNGALLKQYLPQLLDHGLDAVNISLDTLNPQIYQQITGKNQLHEVLAGIGQALKAGLTVKLNAVLQPGINSKEWLSLARLTTQYPLDVRFIEMMPIGCGRSYRPVSNQELLLRLKASYPDLRTDESIRGNGPAVYYQIPRAMGSVGFISALHGKFCSGCNRLRLTAQGKLKPCLCFEEEVDVMEILRGKKKGCNGSSAGKRRCNGSSAGERRCNGSSSGKRRYNGSSAGERKFRLQRSAAAQQSRRPKRAFKTADCPGCQPKAPGTSF